MPETGPGKKANVQLFQERGVHALIDDSKRRWNRVKEERLGIPERQSGKTRTEDGSFLLQVGVEKRSIREIASRERGIGRSGSPRSR